MRTLLGLVFLGSSLAALAGCSRGRGGPQEAPPSDTGPAQPKPAPVEPKKEPEPEPEPAPGELVNLKLPRDGGAWPWAVGSASEPPESKPVSYRGVGPYAATSFSVRPEVGRAAICARLDWYAGGKKGVDPRRAVETTRVMLFDLSSGGIEREWAVPGTHAVLDLSPDGQSILATHPLPGRDRAQLRLWVVGHDWQLKRWSATPHTVPREGLRADSTVKGSSEIRWASFVGERVVSMSRGGQLRVLDTEGLKLVATIDATPCRPTVTPDGSRVAFLVGPMVALLDPVARKITGARWIGQAPPHPALRFSPDGKTLAVGGNGRAVLLDLTTGQLRNAPMPRLDVNDNGLFDKPFGWAGPSHLLADGLLFDPELPNPVWEYASAELTQFRGGRVWACVRPPGSPTAVLRDFELPGPGVDAAVEIAKKRPGAFGLAPGGGVKIDVTGIPEDRRDDVRQTLEKRLRESGFTPDPKAAPTLLASVDSPGTRPTVVYTGLGTFSYTKKPARLRVVLDGKELWNDAWAVEPPYSVELPKGSTLADYLGKLSIGSPDYKAFAIAPLPTHLPGPNAPPAPLGQTDLASSVTPVGR